MKRIISLAVLLPSLAGLTACAPGLIGDGTIDDMVQGDTRRTPAEWEPQAAVWLQWPQSWEGDGVQDSFVAIVEVISWYEDVELIAADDATRSRGQAALASSRADTARITWHVAPSDSSWMRDTGPRYVEVDGELVIQDWMFDGWGVGGGFMAPYEYDDTIPDTVNELLGLPMERVNLIHERGDIEVNGTDTALVSWSVLSHRNPNLTKDEITATIQAAHGVDSVIYTEGFHWLDITRGHVDGMARFVSEDTIVVGDDGTDLLDDAYAQIVEQRPDLNVERLVADDASLYMNWLVGDGFVLAGSGSQNSAARAAFERYFPGRDVHFVDVDALWSNGGGVHCVTNDQPSG